MPKSERNALGCSDGARWLLLLCLWSWCFLRCGPVFPAAAGFLFGFLPLFQKKGRRQGTDQLFLENPADWHRPKNRNSFRYPQRLRRTSTAKCSLKVSSWPDPYVVMDQGTERAVVYFVMDVVAGARRTLGRHKTGGVPPKPPATLLLSLWPLVFWDFGSLHQKRCGVISYALLRPPYLRPRRCGDLGFVSRHKLAEHPTPDVPAAPDVEASCITFCRGRRVSFSERSCGVTVCLQSRRRRWDCLVFPKGGHTSVRESPAWFYQLQLLFSRSF